MKKSVASALFLTAAFWATWWMLPGEAWPQTYRYYQPRQRLESRDERVREHERTLWPGLAGEGENRPTPYFRDDSGIVTTYDPYTGAHIQHYYRVTDDIYIVTPLD